MVGRSLVPPMVMVRAFSALDAMAVVDLSGPSEFEGVAFFQPIEISGLRIEGPVDGLLSAIGGERCV